MNREMEAYLSSAISAARQAGAFIRSAFGKPVVPEFKSPTDPVTEIDRRSEQIILQALQAAHPEIGFWGEELGRRGDVGPHYWLVDPLDGTKNFVHAYPFVAVSIALVLHDSLALGVVYDPLRDELFHAVKGAGAFCNDRPIEVSQARTLREAMVVTGFNLFPPQQKELIWKACVQCQGLRRGGASALDLCQLAAGRLDAMWEWNLKPWDLAAAVLVIQEAQGTISRIDGSPFDLHEGEVLATNTNLHRPFVDFLKF